MNTPRYASAVAKHLRKHLPAASSIEGDQARGVATIERAMRARARRRLLIGIGGTVVAAAAVAVLAGQIWKPNRAAPHDAGLVAIEVSPAGRGAAVDRGQTEHRLEARALLESGQRIETPLNGGASLQLSTGTSMALAGRTSFRVDSQGSMQRFSLQQGELTAHVAKLTATQRFIIDTPDAEIEVRGTRFRLRVVEQAEICGSGNRTRLEVTEGVVQARAGGTSVDVKAGESWPADCTAKPEPAAKASTSAGVEAPAPKPAAVHGNDGQAANERTSALAPQNDLFAEGVARRRQGDVNGALRAYQELLTRFPNGPLAENAMVERMRLLAGSAEAKAEARRYLARYPRGFAAAEAQKLAAEP
jgi:ferric-dicitrate binding protein FerR (iron transport regulator)